MAQCVSFACRDLFALFDFRLLAIGLGQFPEVRRIHAAVARFNVRPFEMTEGCQSW